ncbi:MAG TPA: S8/S53 family peptidase, partial [Streptosporangiaceae bacterium]|nr:S8/S53 family peptidase [Streptosporangiaceae bacterium]
GSAWDAAIAMAEVARAGVDVVNLSFGEIRTDDDSAPMVLETAVKRFGPETVVVAAAGNNGEAKNLPPELVHDGLEPNSASYPAALVDVIGVGALDQSGQRAAFTPHPAPWIALLAPGVGLTGAYVRGEVTIEHKDKNGKILDAREVSFPGTAVWEGCSFAAGVVSGAIAAGTVPGHRSARQALDGLLHPDPGKPGGHIRPNSLASPG